ncbi:unnamed protein product, partial [Rangifer tarandus platyrhynchus]
ASMRPAKSRMSGRREWAGGPRAKATAWGPAEPAGNPSSTQPGSSELMNSRASGCTSLL